MKAYSVFVSCMFLLRLIGCIDTETYSSAEELYSNITNGKNINIRPVLNQNQPVNVNVHLRLIFLQEFNEVSGKLSLTGIFLVNWKDETVSWDPKNNGIYSLTYMDDVFWKPMFVLGNSFGEVKFMYKDDSIKRIFYDGYVWWTPGDNYEVTCAADVSIFPFDTHQCYLRVLPMGYSDSEINIWPAIDYINIDWYTEHRTWVLVETRVIKYKDPQRLEFFITLKRKPIYYVINLILPICVMSFLNVFVFLLPAESGERVGYAVTVLLAIAVFLTISSASLPATANPRIPTISLFLFSEVVLSALILILVILGLRFYHRDGKVSRSGRRFVKFMRCLRCKCLPVKKKTHSESKIKLGTTETIYRGTRSSNFDSLSDSLNLDEITWINVGEETDFVFGWLMLLLIITVTVLYIVDVTIGLKWW